MDFTELFKQRYGLSHDPNWERYHQWPSEYFPINLPACTVLKWQQEIEGRDMAIISWEVEKGIPIVCRFDDSKGGVLIEVLPEPVEGIGEYIPAAEYVRKSETFKAESIAGINGFGFEWVFEIPVKPAGTLQPWHQLGVVRIDGSELLGKETVITVNAGGREKGREEFLLAQRMTRGKD